VIHEKHIPKHLSLWSTSVCDSLTAENHHMHLHRPVCLATFVIVYWIQCRETNELYANNNSDNVPIRYKLCIFAIWFATANIIKTT
jgi:hypothetical protein